MNSIDFMGEVLHSARTQVGPLPAVALTSREDELMAHLADGLLYKEIADALQISESLVKNLVHSAYSKLRARNRLEAIRAWLLQKGGTKAL